MARKFSELREKMSPESRARSRALGGRLDLVAHIPNNEPILLKTLSSE